MEPIDGLPARARQRAMATIAISVGLAVLDSAIANIALPTIASDMAATPSATIWVVNGYQLAVTVSLLPFAFLGDMFGYKRVYLAGLAVFTAASLACALAPSLPWLVAARVVQGFGGAGIMSVNTALIRFIFPRAMLARPRRQLGDRGDVLGARPVGGGGNPGGGVLALAVRGQRAAGPDRAGAGHPRAAGHAARRPALRRAQRAAERGDAWSSGHRGGRAGGAALAPGSLSRWWWRLRSAPCSCAASAGLSCRCCRSICSAARCSRCRW